MSVSSRKGMSVGRRERMSVSVCRRTRTSK